MAAETPPAENNPADNAGIEVFDCISIQVFWKEEHGIFTEKNSATHVVTLQPEIAQVSIPVTVFPGLTQIRIDPATAAGVFYLHAVFVTGENDKVLMSWEDIRRNWSCANLLINKSRLAESAFLSVALTCDPMIWFPLSVPLPDDGKNSVHVHITVSGLQPGVLQQELSQLSATALTA